MDDDMASQPLKPPGFRLHKLEVYNWGTFDSTAGEVHTFQPAGNTSLFIGQNGSGKSTLVDALLTLLVRPAVRNYNVAAGAHKQERDERTYVKGAFGSFSRDEDNRANTQFLRPTGSHYSALLACFTDGNREQTFTLAVLLYLNSEGGCEKLYCFANGERSIAADCAHIETTEKLRQQMEKRGFDATTTYTEYYGWFRRMTGVQFKAMDVFNQTVAVKDIQSLNRFVRDHMLEAKPWAEKVDSLLNHFTQLHEAHQSLLRVQRQFQLLEPVVTAGGIYRAHADKLENLKRLIEATDSFFRQKTVDLLGPASDEWRRSRDAVIRQRERLDQEIGEAAQECRRLQNEIERAGGERLRQLPLLIKQHESLAASKRTASAQYHAALSAAGIDELATDAAGFDSIQARLPQLLRDFDQQIGECDQRKEGLVIERAEINRTLREDEGELESLKQRQGNLPHALVTVRQNLCKDLDLTENELPFAAELIAVKPDEQAWEASVELALHNFALSLLVPGKHYHLVAGLVDRTRLVDMGGTGQRLVYLRVGDRAKASGQPALHSQSLVRKLVFRDGHPLLPWVKAELEERFDYRCCDTVEEFQQAQGLAMTRHRHLKVRGVRHEKDDRDRVSDPRFFVLGWNNAEKKRRLAQRIFEYQERRSQLNARVQAVEDRLAALRTRHEATRKASEVVDFGAIDHAAEQRQVEGLRLEKTQLEENNDTIRLLKRRLADAQSRHTGLGTQRDEVLVREAKLADQIRQAELLIYNAGSVLQERQTTGALQRHAASFPDLEAFFVEHPLTAANVLAEEQRFINTRRAETDRLRQDIEPLRIELTKAMSRFLREFQDERADLEAQEDYLDSFCDLREHIRKEDLPRHERRFKERLNEKVIQEIGLLNGAFQSERNEIIGRIKQLNQSLRQLEYRPGTHMVLEPRPVRDAEVVEFQNALKECLAGTFEGTAEADEARFLRIQKLITRLREEHTWRDKVTDVRRWFDFAAHELDNTTKKERGYYEDSTGQSGGEKAKLAFTILVAAIAYQYDIDPDHPTSSRFHFVVVDEMFSKVDDQYSEYALELFQKFGLQLLIVAPLDAKALVTEPYVGCYLHVVKDARTNRSEVFSMTAQEFADALSDSSGGKKGAEPAPRRVRSR
jgi:uncharacterized protein YPO0396